MKFKKLIFAYGLSIVLSLSLSSPIQASEIRIFGQTKSEIGQMTDDEFVEFIVDVTTGYPELSYAEKQNELKKIGVDLSEEKTQQTRSATNSNSDTTLKLYSSHRYNQSYHYLTAEVIAKKNLASNCAIEDAISIEWNPNSATYYNTSNGQYCSGRDGSKRNKGIYVFNLYDSNLTASGKAAYCSVMVKPKAVTGVTIDFGTKYIRTYNVTNFVWNLGFSLNYTDNGPTGGATFNLSGSQLQRYTVLYSDNALYL